MTNRRSLGQTLIAVVTAIMTAETAAGQGSSLRFYRNDPQAYEFADQRILPPTFGSGEFTMELWVKPDTSYQVGEVDRGTIGQLSNWSSEDLRPHSVDYWWLGGNWLLDGFSRPDGFDMGNSRAGSFGLQFYGGGRVRWTFADDDTNVPLGKVWGVQVGPARNTPSLLDGKWHHIACVRRWTGDTAALLELWVDGRIIASTPIPQRVNMRKFWDSLPHPRNPRNLGGWSWGSEVMTAWKMYFTQYEDYKGLLDELRFWDRALSPDELTRAGGPVTGKEPGLVGWFPFDEGTGTVAHDRKDSTRVLTLYPRGSPMWIAENAPLRR